MFVGWATPLDADHNIGYMLVMLTLRQQRGQCPAQRAQLTGPRSMHILAVTEE
jgi:hypothetical protein